MIAKKYPFIRLTNHAIKGNYFGAFTNSNENSFMGYTLFLSNIDELKNYCECAGFIHGKICYHLKKAMILQEKLFGKGLSDL